MSAGKPADAGRKILLPSVADRVSALAVFELAFKDLLGAAICVIQVGCGLVVAGVQGSEETPHHIHRVGHSTPMTFTTTRLRRWPSNSA